MALKEGIIEPHNIKSDNPELWDSLINMFPQLIREYGTTATRLATSQKVTEAIVDDVELKPDETQGDGETSKGN